MYLCCLLVRFAIKLISQHWHVKAFTYPCKHKAVEYDRSKSVILHLSLHAFVYFTYVCFSITRV
jgi:hypothetical protein